ncbi:hypothetical protein CL630_02765 [bacterium]|nr:hypothetical protein [bacterium]|tara:strand:+ start:9071 stop:9514 length:444 start_codon:yes stop_codon:yes gene_type:complete
MNRNRTSGIPLRARQGFTILELLVVLAIIAIGSTIVFTYFSVIQEKSRDSRRVNDMNEISKALNIYYAGNSQFPVVTSEVVIDSTDVLSTELEGDGSIKETPKDPQHPALTYRYISSPDGSTYTLTFCLETDNIQEHAAGCSNTKNP